MSAAEPRKLSETTFAQDVGAFAGYWLRDRRVQVALAIAVVGAGAALNWGWLVAAGVAPLLLSLAPCAAMCALGVCMMCRTGQSCSNGAAEKASPIEGVTAAPAERPQPEAQPLAPAAAAAAIASAPGAQPQPERQAPPLKSAAEPIPDEGRGRRDPTNQGGR